MVSNSTRKGFTCDVCQQRFSRNDHLKRHYVRHTGRNPYQCAFCSSGFARSDVLRTHYAGCTERAGREIPLIVACDQPRQACDRCFAKKLKCDRIQPCASCARKRETCSYAPNPRTINPVSDLAPIESQLQAPHPRQESPSPDHPVLDNVAETDSLFYLPQFKCFGFTCTLPTDEAVEDIITLSPSIMKGSDESEQPYANDLMKSLTLCLPQLTQDVALQKQMFSKIYLMATARIQRLVRTYFWRFHRSMSVLHPASFDPSKVSISLLAAVVFVGALYSEDLSERHISFGLDLVECLVFSSKTFNTSHGIGMYDSATDESAQTAFEDLQAGCLVVVAQHCFGNQAAKARVMESRFGEIIRVCRKMGLPVSRQAFEDRETEQRWLLKEARIRTMTFITLLDRDFHFFHNLPCRLSMSELEFDTPCSESVFNAEHPYGSPRFRFQSEDTVSSAYKKLMHQSEAADALDLMSLNTLLTSSLIHSHLVIYLEHIESIKPRPISEPLSRGLNNWYQLWKKQWNERDVSDRIEDGLLKAAHDYWLAARLILESQDSISRKVYVHSCSELLKDLKANPLHTLDTQPTND